MASSGSQAAFLLLELPDSTLACIFSQLPLRDALRLSWACKPLHAISGPATRRRYACAACKHPLFDPCVIFNSAAHAEAPRLRVQDGPALVAEAEHLEGAVLSEEFVSEDVYLHRAVLSKLGRQALGEAGIRVQSVSCAGCRLYLGLRLMQLGEHRLGECSGSGLVLHATVLGRVWLPQKYLTLVRADGSEDPESARGRTYACTGARSRLLKPGECGAALFEKRAVLSKEHCWNAGGGTERAYFINHFLPGAVVERDERVEMLCQGEMRVSDAYCAKCGTRIGWRFCADLEGRDNENQVGRYGVVKSAFKKIK